MPSLFNSSPSRMRAANSAVKSPLPPASSVMAEAALSPQGCLLVTRLDNQQYNPEINRLAQLLTEQGAQVFVVSVDATPVTTD